MSSSSAPASPPRPSDTAQTNVAALPQERQGWRFAPHAIIFFSSACIMVMELVAGRLIARHLGSSLYTWTTIIGVVLAGMSVGNWIGGRLADRWRPRKMLGWLFLLASATCVLALATNYAFADITSSRADWLPKWFTEYFRSGEGRWVARIVLAVVAIFLPPAMALGMISPVTAKLALQRSQRVGATIGSVYAWGAAGSILGTFATGFYLIAALGATGVVLTTGLALAVLGLLLGPARWVHALWVLLLGAAMMLAKVPLAGLRQAMTEANLPSLAAATIKAENLAYELALREGEKPLYGQEARCGDLSWAPHPFARDSNYQFVKVGDSFEDGRALRVLELDYLIHGYVDLDDLTHLHYDYERVYRDVARRYHRQAGGDGRKAIEAFFIGGGAYTFPRWVLEEWPGSDVDVAEIDPVVVEANHVATGLPRDTPIRTYVGDARNVVDDLPADKKYDFIFGDAFTDLSVPFHLTTLEFSRKIAAHLKPQGAYLVNIIDDIDSGLFLGAYVLTLQKVFPHVYVFTTEAGGVESGRDTFVVAASNVEVDFRDFLPRHEDEESGAEDGFDEAGNWVETPPGSGRVAGSILSEEDLAGLAAKCKGRILTDDDAPVENLLAPVVRRRAD